MPRSQYIYLIRKIKDQDLLVGFTVKHEAVTWAERSDWTMDAIQLSRLRDGVPDSEEVIPWPEETS